MSRMLEELELIRVKVLKVTDKAIRVRAYFHDEDEPGEWIQKADISPDGEITARAESGQEGDMLIPESLAHAKGLV